METVVAITRWNGTCSMLTSAKLTEGYLVVGITVIRQECGRTLARVRVSQTYISIIIISLQWT